MSRKGTNVGQPPPPPPEDPNEETEPASSAPPAPTSGRQRFGGKGPSKEPPPLPPPPQPPPPTDTYREEEGEERRDSDELAPEKEVYPISSFKEHQTGNSSTFVIACHFFKSLFGPMILAMPAAFKNGGLLFSAVGFISMVALVAYNIRRMVESAKHLSKKEKMTVRTYDEVAYVSFTRCSPKTKTYASFIKFFINLLFIITYLDGCSIFLIFVARNLESIVMHYSPNTFINVYYLIFCEISLIMTLCSIRNLKFIAPFSFAACILLILALILTISNFSMNGFPPLYQRKYIGTPQSILKFISINSFALSGISIALTLKSSMRRPQKFFSQGGIYTWSLSVFTFVYIVFGFLGYLEFGEKTNPSIMLNLRVDTLLTLTIKFLSISSVLLTTPIVFYVAFNVLWNNYITKRISLGNIHLTEFFVRYILITSAFLVASAYPNLGAMIALKGALFHSHLEVSIPAVLDYVSFYPEEGKGKYKGRLLRLILFLLIGIFFCVAGTAAAVLELFQSEPKS